MSDDDCCFDLLEKAKNLKNEHRDYSGLLVLDGGITSDDLQKSKNLDIDIVIQGGAIFG